MEIKNFIKIYDEALPWNVLSNTIRFANILKFEKSKIGGDEHTKIDFNVRRTYVKALSNLNDSLSNVHWFNLLAYFLMFTRFVVFMATSFSFSTNPCLSLNSLNSGNRRSSSG